MKLWVDADRPPDVDWVWSKTTQGAITMLKGGCVERISFAPDQPDLVEPVLDWMISNESEAKRAVHPRSARAKNFHKLLRSAVQVAPPESEAS